jgi:hypothetical protein
MTAGQEKRRLHFGAVARELFEKRFRYATTNKEEEEGWDICYCTRRTTNGEPPMSSVAKAHIHLYASGRY